METVKPFYAIIREFAPWTELAYLNRRLPAENMYALAYQLPAPTFNDPRPYRAYRLDMITGPLAGKMVVSPHCRLVEISENELVENGEVCLCRRFPKPHEPSKIANCLTNFHEKGNHYCAACGEPCEVIERKDYDPDEFWGMPCRRPAFVNISSCCDSEDIYTNPSLTEYD
jgi:hypothetical protein